MENHKLTIRDILDTYKPLYIVINGKHDYRRHKEHFNELPNEVLNTTRFQYGYYAPSKMLISTY